MLKSLATAVAVLLTVGAAHAEKRIALVIGNSGYENISPLTNAKNDAELMSATLRQVGFDVITATDVDYSGMREAIRGFGKALRGAGRDAVGLLYYAGHGVQARETNYLIPVGAEIQTDADLELGALSASQVLAQMEAAGNRLNLVILDACRNNPFRSRFRSSARGLARIQAASGTLIAFAAAPGQVAEDGASGNSPYTTALVEAIAEPGLTVEQVFKKVRVKVENETGGNQTPWEESSLRGDFYFSGPVPGADDGSQKVQVLTAPSTDKEALFWNSVKDSGNPALLQTYVDRFPNGTFAGLATVMIQQLKDKPGRKKLASADPSAPLEPEQPGTPDEMVLLAHKYESGNGRDRDAAMAAEWYRKAARAGSAEARYRLGVLYYHGHGVGQSYTEAAVQILDAVKADHPPAVDALTTVAVLNDPEFLATVQRKLQALGYYRSTIDGVWGPGSRRAIAAYSGGEPPDEIDRPERVERIERPVRRVQRRQRIRERYVEEDRRHGSPYKRPRGPVPIHCQMGVRGNNVAFHDGCPPR